jgi:dihydrofolate reductase
MRKVVASTTLGSSDWENTTVIPSGLEDAVRALKQEDGGPIIVAGSRSVVHALFAAGLVDEVHLQVFPLVLGSGIRVFPDTPQPIRLEHIASRPIDNGVVLQTYRVPS